MNAIIKKEEHESRQQHNVNNTIGEKVPIFSSVTSKETKPRFGLWEFGPGSSLAVVIAHNTRSINTFPGNEILWL